MKLLTEVTDLSELNRLRLLFEANGVLIHVGNEDSARNFGFVHPVGKFAIHVIYEEQYQDALMLMDDEDHTVANPLDVESYKKYIEENHSDAVTRLFNKILFISAVTILAIIGAVWVLSRLG